MLWFLLILQLVHLSSCQNYFVLTDYVGSAPGGVPLIFSPNNDLCNIPCPAGTDCYLAVSFATEDGQGNFVGTTSWTDNGQYSITSDIILNTKNNCGKKFQIALGGGGTTLNPTTDQSTWLDNAIYSLNNVVPNYYSALNDLFSGIEINYEETPASQWDFANYICNLASYTKSNYGFVISLSPFGDPTNPYDLQTLPQYLAVYNLCPDSIDWINYQAYGLETTDTTKYYDVYLALTQPPYNFPWSKLILGTDSNTVNQRGSQPPDLFFTYQSLPLRGLMVWAAENSYPFFPIEYFTHSNSLNNGQTLYAGQGLYSANGYFYAAMQTDGNFVVYYSTGGAYWASQTSPGQINEGVLPFYITMQPDNNLVIYDSYNNYVWASGTFGQGSGGAYLSLNDNGILYLADGNNNRLWSFDTLQHGYTLYQNQFLKSADGQYEALMQTDGNFVIYQWGRAIWETRTNGHGQGPYGLILQTDGNLVLYSQYSFACKCGNAIWASGTNGRGQEYFGLVLQTDGNLVLYSAYNPSCDSGCGNAIWASNT